MSTHYDTAAANTLLSVEQADQTRTWLSLATIAAAPSCALAMVSLSMGWAGFAAAPGEAVVWGDATGCAGDGIACMP